MFGKFERIATHCIALFTFGTIDPWWITLYLVESKTILYVYLYIPTFVVCCRLSINESGRRLLIDYRYQKQFSEHDGNFLNFLRKARRC